MYFLIESLNEDGYLEDSLVSLAQSISGADCEADFDALEELLDQLKIDLLLQSLEPAGVGARFGRVPKDAIAAIARERICSAALRIAPVKRCLSEKDVKTLVANLRR